MFKALYRWVIKLSGTRHAPSALAGVAFAESSFFPIPPDVMLAPMVLARPDRAYVYAGICTLASVLGGIAGYAIGYFLEPVGHWLLALSGHGDGVDAFQKWYEQWGVWVILFKGLTPIPYKLVTIASGLAKFNFWAFVGASILTRGARFFLVAGLLKRFGPSIAPVLERRITEISIAVIVVVVAAVFALRFL